MPDSILIVEDDEALAEGLALILECRGHCVDLAVNGAEALLHLGSAQNLPSLIITDLMMPIMDGWELIGNLTASNIYRSIPIIVWSGVAETVTKKLALLVRAVVVKTDFASIFTACDELSAKHKLAS